MNNIIIVLGMFVAVPATLITFLARPTGSRLDAVRFILGALLLAPCVLGLLKLWISPTTSSDLEHAFLGTVEQFPFLAMLFFVGLPGFLYKRNPARGFFISATILGAALTWLVTAGPIAVDAAPAAYLQYFIAYGAVVVFAAWWSDAQRSVRLNPQRQN